ncbi:MULTISPECIES: hypothetical protein [Cupriavidus]|nr:MULTISPECIES: hypothetical protein [Cupriavidus]QYY34136.1 hypothetical protein K2O51_32745 [Cupriavidus pinatubonensis]TPQ30847.1 hypothetical protein C2U69_30240 [Cupriavidus pinatubonensis]
MNDNTYPATVIYPDGTSAAISLPLSMDARLGVIQNLVGGCIEGIPLSSGRYMFLSESGEASAINQLATDIARASESIMADDHIAGVAVIVPMELTQ